MKKLYEGKAKILFASEQPDRCIQHFKDSATAFNGLKKEEIPGKGELNCSITSRLFTYLAERGLKSHFIRKVDERSIETLRLEMLPVEVLVRNRVEGSLAKRLPKFAGQDLKSPVVEWCYKDDAQQDPQVSEDLLQVLFEQDLNDIQEMKQIALRVNKELKSFFEERNLMLVDFKLEFGKKDGQLLLADEISGDTCRIWDRETKTKFDKDRFRFELGDLVEGYKEIWRRIQE